MEWGICGIFAPVEGKDNYLLGADPCCRFSLTAAYDKRVAIRE
jgi:hypothetical protein